MWMIFLFLLTGVIIGFLFRNKHNVLKTAAKTTSWAVFLLVLFLGISVGGNKNVMSTIGVLGWQALITSVGSIAGSLLLSGIVYFFFFRDIHEK